MDEREFLRKYHDYVTESRAEAEAELERLGPEAVRSVSGRPVPLCVVEFQGRYGLMLRSARDFLQDLGVLEK